MSLRPKDYVKELLLSDGPIRPSELLTREQYESVRPELLAIGREHKSQRRTRLNESLTLLIESRVTIWLQIHEELRWLSKPSTSDRKEILETNNLVAPCAKNLTGTIFIDGSDSKIVHEYVQALNQDALTIDLIINGWTYSAAPIKSEYIRNDVIHSRTFLRNQRSDYVDQVRMMGQKVAVLTPAVSL